MKRETIEEFEESMQRLQATMSEKEYDQLISDFWDYFHNAYC
jgi:phosphoenolpyruvate carboxylase